MAAETRNPPISPDTTDFRCYGGLFHTPDGEGDIRIAGDCEDADDREPGSGWPIGSVHGDGDEAEAFAILFCEAPDLLAACEAVLRGMTYHNIPVLHDGDGGRISVNDLRDVIKRARGEG